jgi:hypothetical protein
MDLPPLAHLLLQLLVSYSSFLLFIVDSRTRARAQPCKYNEFPAKTKLANFYTDYWKILKFTEYWEQSSLLQIK